MKTFRFLRVVLATALVCANFASCRTDVTVDSFPDNPFGDDANEKKLVKIVSESVVYGQTTEETITFKYDSEGKLIETVEKGKTNYEEWSGIAEYVWTNDAVIYREDYTYKSSHDNINETYECKYQLSNGLVRSLDYGGGDIEYLSYNKDGRYDNEKTWEWDGDKLKCIYGDYKSVYTYGEPCTSGYYPFCSIDAGTLFFAHPELLGVRTKQLPTSCVATGYYDSYVKPYSSTYEYELDLEGYVVKVVVTTIYEDNQIETYVETFTWE